MGMEMEDDAFFAELSKRIALVIMEEEEEIVQISHAMVAAPPYSQEQAWRQRGMKGTGVFIPLSLLPKKRSAEVSSKTGAATCHSEKPKPGGGAKAFHHRRRPPPRQLR